MSFDWEPHLRGPGIHLRPVREADRDRLYAVAADPLIWAMHPAHDRHQRPVFDAFLDQAFADRGGLVAEDARTGSVLGFSRYSATRTNPGEVEIGWTFLARSCWGRGVNGKMKQLMLDHAFTCHDRVIFMVGKDNLRSRRAVSKLGAVEREGIEDIHLAGRSVRHIVYVLSKEGWNEHRPA